MNRLPYKNIFKNNIYEKLHRRACDQRVSNSYCHVTIKYWTLIGLFPIILSYDSPSSTWLPIEGLISDSCQEQSSKNSKKIIWRVSKLKILKTRKMSVIVCHGVKTDFCHCWLQFNNISEQELIVKTIRKQVWNIM